jgi:hypothetical protein
MSLTLSLSMFGLEHEPRKGVPLLASRFLTDRSPSYDVPGRRRDDQMTVA